MAQLRSLAALLILGTAASACTSRGAPPPNRSVYSLNQPVVQRTDYVMDVTTSADGLSESEQDRLAGWFHSLQIGYGDRIAVDQGGYESAEVRSDVADVAGQFGVLLDGEAPVTAGQLQPGNVRIVVRRTTANVPGCPNWEGPDRLSSTSSNYGCATNANLSAMVADPNDLVRGQSGTGTVDSSTATRAIRTHRNRQPTGSGALPNVGTGGQ